MKRKGGRDPDIIKLDVLNLKKTGTTPGELEALYSNLVKAKLWCCCYDQGPKKGELLWFRNEQSGEEFIPFFTSREAYVDTFRGMKLAGSGSKPPPTKTQGWNFFTAVAFMKHPACLNPYTASEMMFSLKDIETLSRQAMEHKQSLAEGQAAEPVKFRQFNISKDVFTSLYLPKNAKKKIEKEAKKKAEKEEKSDLESTGTINATALTDEGAGPVKGERYQTDRRFISSNLVQADAEPFFFAINGIEQAMDNRTSGGLSQPRTGLARHIVTGKPWSLVICQARLQGVFRYNQTEFQKKHRM